MSEFKNKQVIKKRLIPIFAFSTVASLASCNLFSHKAWSWEASTIGDSVNYCLLIGQLDHNDSMYRTRGTRQILGTRVDAKDQKDNFNLEGVKQGSIKLAEGTSDEKTFTVNELEHLEQKSFSGATWDPITANGSAGTWISKHGSNITMFVSNNDGMAEGAIKAHNWLEGMPIFGYDANTSTLKLMKQNKIMGTIDSNTPAQCLATSLLIRNIVNNKDKIEAMAKEGKFFNPVCDKDLYNGYRSGFRVKFEDESILTYDKTTNPDYATGYMESIVNVRGCSEEDFTSPNEKSYHAILVNNRTVTNDLYVPEDIDSNRVKTDVFFDDSGAALEPYEKYLISEPANASIKEFKTEEVKNKPISIWQSWYSATDTFFTGNMDPYFTITQGEDKFNINVTEARGNGSDESVILNSLDSALTKEKYDAYLINPVQQPNSAQYITKIATKLGLQEKESWFDRDPTPIIFWNRQPTDRSGKISVDDVMCNKYFKYVYYVGFDAQQGGELQGQMVKFWLDKTYKENLKK